MREFKVDLPTHEQLSLDVAGEHLSKIPDIMLVLKAHGALAVGHVANENGQKISCMMPIRSIEAFQDGGEMLIALNS